MLFHVDFETNDNKSLTGNLNLPTADGVAHSGPDLTQCSPSLPDQQGAFVKDIFHDKSVNRLLMSSCA